MLVQCNPSIPVEVLGKGYGETIFILDYGPEHDILWGVALDSNGEVWWVPNTRIRFIKNYSLGRTFSEPRESFPTIGEMKKNMKAKK